MIAEVRRVLICMPHYLGDAMMTIPALTLLEQLYPGSKQVLWCIPPVAELFGRRPGVECFSVASRRGPPQAQVVRALRTGKYDVGILFRNSFMDAFAMRLAGIKTVAGYKKDGNAFLLNVALHIERGRHYVNHYAYLVNTLADGRFDRLPSMSLKFGEAPTIEFSKPGPVIGIVFGNPGKGPKYCAVEQARRLLTGLASSGYNLVLLGDSADRVHMDDCVVALNDVPERFVDLVGQTTVPEFMDRIASLDGLLTIDSAAMQIGAAVGSAMIVLVGRGPQPFDRVRPKHAHAIYLHGDPGCILDEDFIASIDDQAVFDAVETLVTTSARQPT